MEAQVLQYHKNILSGAKLVILCQAPQQFDKITKKKVLAPPRNDGHVANNQVYIPVSV